MPSILSKPVEPIDEMNVDEMNARSKFERIVEFVDESFDVPIEEKQKCIKKALITIKLKMTTGELPDGTALALRKTKESFVLLDENNTPVFIHKFDSLVQHVIVKSEMMEEVVEQEKKFNKDQKHPKAIKFQDIGFYKHQQLGIWGNFNAKEWIEDIKCWEEKGEGKMTLKDCDIRTCKINGRKYKRITFTNEKINQLSHVEVAFDNLIDGFTYLILPDAWKAIKDEVISLVNYEKTTYGSKTRYDMNGDEYKAEH
jgi:hypothetical protein